jgi:hypothetical protein
MFENNVLRRILELMRGKVTEEEEEEEEEDVSM